MAQVQFIYKEKKKKQDYPQPPPLTGDELTSYLKEPNVAIIGSQNKDGTVHMTPVWYKYQDGEILFGTQEISTKIRNIKRNHKVSVHISTHTMPYKGVLIYGQAKLDFDDVLEKRVEIFLNYTSEGSARRMVESYAQKWKPVIVRVKIEKIISFDYGK